MDPDRYLDRIGVGPDTLDRDREAVARLQRAHVRSVPFETLSITGDPFGNREGAGVSLAIDDLYEKIVERRRGGFCYELNGAFGWLLDALGFEFDRVAARVVGDDGPRPPANHLSAVVSLDSDYVVDVGLGSTALRRPLPLDGTTREDEAGIEWRAVDSDRPDANLVVQYRQDGAWEDRYDFQTDPREMRYFEATCEYLTLAPESPFTGDPVVTMATKAGYAKLTSDSLVRVEGERRERSVDPGEWHEVLESTFGLRYRA